MDERLARMCTHQANIGHYQNLLKTNLSDVEQQFVEKRLAEERFAIAMLNSMSPPKGRDASGVHK